MEAGARLGSDPSALDEVATCLRTLVTELRRSRRWPDGAWDGPDGARARRDVERAAADRVRVAVEMERVAHAVADAAIEQRRASRATPAHAVPWDSRADGGRLVQVVGSAHASTVVVVVPGVGSDPGDRARFRTDAERLWRALADRVDDPAGLAVVSWLGYDPPDVVLGALDVSPADEGAAALVRWVARLRSDGAERVLVVGHSYGGVVVGRAAADGMAADVVVQLGSPGVGEPGATAAIADRGIELRAVRNVGDPIGFVAGRLVGLYGEDDVGIVPSLPTSGTGHGSYLSDPVLVAALARLALPTVPSAP